jgi:hypothetical protein
MRWYGALEQVRGELTSRGQVQRFLQRSVPVSSTMGSYSGTSPE